MSKKHTRYHRNKWKVAENMVKVTIWSLGFADEGLLRRENYINGTFHDLLSKAIVID